MTTVSPVVSTGRRSSASLALGPLGIALATGLVLAEAVDALVAHQGLASTLRCGLGAAGGAGLRRPRPRSPWSASASGRPSADPCWPGAICRTPATSSLYILAIAPFMTLLSVGSAVILGSHARWLEAPWTATWPRLAVVVVTLLAMDLCNWIAHLVDHRIGAFWRRACVAPLAGGAERPHLVPGPPADAHERLPAGHRSRAGPDRGASTRARPHHRLRLSGHPAAHQRELVLRPARLGAGQSGLPPAPPLGGAPGRQSRRRAHRVGPPGRDRPAPRTGESALCHRPGRASGPRRAGRRRSGAAGSWPASSSSRSAPS